MFTRHLKKFNNTAEMEAAIRDGLVASPYVIFNADKNTANMVLPDGKEAADIEYEPWMSPYLVSNMYIADPSNGIYTDPSGNFEIGYAEDEREGWKYVDGLNFYLNSQYLEGWGSTAETIETETVGGSNTPLVFITEKNALDNAIEYWSNLSGYSESKTLSYLVYEIMNESREIRYDDMGGNTRTWLTEFADGTETSFWGEDIEYSLYGSQSLQGYYMRTFNDERTPEYYILVAYKKEEEDLRASKDNILRAAIDTESMYKVYKAGIFRAYDYSADEPVVPSEDPTLTFNYTDVTYNTVADFVPAIYGDTSYYDSVAFFIVDQSTIDDIFIEHGGWSHGDALWSLIESDTASVIEDASAGDTVSLASSLNAYYDSQNVYVFALLEHFENAVRDFYQPNATDDNYAYETVQWAEAAPTTTYFSMYITSQGFDPNDSSTYNVNISFSGYPGDMTWPYVTFGAYKVTEMTPYADTTAMSNVLGQTYDYFPAGGSGTYTLSIPIDLQPGESATYCVCAAPMNDMPATDMMYVDYRSAVVTVPSEGGDSSTDVSLGYKFSVGANNGGYFNTGYVPGADTVVQLKGKIINDGASAHGIKGDYNDWMYRIFGNEGDVYFDRMDDQVRITAAVNDIENTSHEYEFGNYYIKVDGVTEATDSESDLTNFYTELSLLVFATSQIGAMGETILDTLAAPGTEVEYFKILEPDGNGGLNLEKDLRPALDASGNVCMYDQVAGDIIYPEGSSVNIIATAISGNEPGPDSSTSSTDIIEVHGNPGPTPSTENPFVTLVVDASIDALSSWDHMEVGIYSLNHYENNGYTSLVDYRTNGFIKTCTIALTDGTAHYSIQSTDDLNCARIPAGDGYTFTGYDDTICVVAWFEIGYGAQQVAESNEIFELYEYELPRDL